MVIGQGQQNPHEWNQRQDNLWWNSRKTTCLVPCFCGLCSFFASHIIIDHIAFTKYYHWWVLYKNMFLLCIVYCNLLYKPKLFFSNSNFKTIFSKNKRKSCFVWSVRIYNFFTLFYPHLSFFIKLQVVLWPLNFGMFRKDPNVWIEDGL